MTHPPETMQQEAPYPGFPAYKMQELAQIAWFIVAALKRAEQHRDQRERDGVRRAMRDVQAGRNALRRATNDPNAATDDVPRPLDMDTFQKAERLVSEGPRSAKVVSLSGLGRSTYAVVGEVPGIGRVGGEFASQKQAEEVRDAILHAPQETLGVWAVTDQKLTVEGRYTREAERTRLRREYPAMVREMNRDDPGHRAVTHRLLNHDPGSLLDTAAVQTFGEDIRNPPADNPVTNGNAQPPQASGSPGTAPPQPGPQASTTEQSQESQAAEQDPQPAAQGTAGVPAASAATPPASASPRNPIVLETMETVGGATVRIIDLQAARRQYTAQGTNAGRVDMEYRDASGNPVSEREWLQSNAGDAVDTIANLDTENRRHSDLAARWLGQGVPEVDMAVQDRFPGLAAAVANRRLAANTASGGATPTPALKAALQRGETQGGPQAGAAEGGTQEHRRQAAKRPAAGRDAQHAQRQ